MARERVVIHTAAEIAGIRKAAREAAWVLDQCAQLVRPGVTTLQIDCYVKELIESRGGVSAFYNYGNPGYPGQLCISVNDEVVHGIGVADRVIEEGDLVSLDVGVALDGFIGDNATTVCAGEPTPAQRRLMEVSKSSLDAGIAAAVGGRYVGDISRAVEKVVAKAGYSVVRDFVGHGCGVHLHEPPEVPNFAQRNRGARLQPGMVLAIEPMVNAGSHRVEVDRKDNWTVRTADHSLSVHYEHMVLITKEKPEVLTWPRIT